MSLNCGLCATPCLKRSAPGTVQVSLAIVSGAAWTLVVVSVEKPVHLAVTNRSVSEENNGGNFDVRILLLTARSVAS